MYCLQLLSNPDSDLVKVSTAIVEPRYIATTTLYA
jgi:hypothetical protein